MGIEYRPVEGRMCPMLICDVCGERIRDGNGIVVYSDEEDHPAPRFVHKVNPDGGPSTCNQECLLMSWSDLDVFVAYLLQNAGIKITPEVERRAASLEF